MHNQINFLSSFFTFESAEEQSINSRITMNPTKRTKLESIFEVKPTCLHYRMTLFSNKLNPKCSKPFLCVYFGISSVLKSYACHGHRLSFVTEKSELIHGGRDGCVTKARSQKTQYLFYHFKKK